MLGASNLARAFPTVVSQACLTFSRPLSIVVAKGHGRSYGKEAGCFGKKNSGIFFSGIWQELEQEKKLPTAAWITDIGNDLAYEIPVKTILKWVFGCVDRLLELNATVVVGDLPLARLRSASEAKLRLFRCLFFPACRLSMRELLTRAEQLSAGLHEQANLRKIPIFPAQNESTGIDPIHIRRRSFTPMWSELFASCTALSQESSPCSQSLPDGWRLRCLQPETSSWFGILKRVRQPCFRLRDGTTISLY